jgi:hypothetical protein
MTVDDLLNRNRSKKREQVLRVQLLLGRFMGPSRGQAKHLPSFVLDFENKIKILKKGIHEILISTIKINLKSIFLSVILRAIFINSLKRFKHKFVSKFSAPSSPERMLTAPICGCDKFIAEYGYNITILTNLIKSEECSILLR